MEGRERERERETKTIDSPVFLSIQSSTRFEKERKKERNENGSFLLVVPYLRASAGE